MEKKLGLKVISSAALAGLLFTAAPVLPADALTDNFSITVPKVADDKEDQTLGTIILKEDADSNAYFNEGDLLTVTLPSGVEFSNIRDAVYGIEAKASDYVKLQGVTLTPKAVSDKYFTVQVGDVTANTDGKLYVYFGESGKASKVDIDNGVTGDIKVEIDGGNSSINSEFITVGRVYDGGTTTTVSDTETLKIDGDTKIGTIKIQENVQGKLVADDNDKIELKLPNDYQWVAGKIEVNGVNIDLAAGNSDYYTLSDDADTLIIEVTGGSDRDDITSPGFITIDAEIYVPDDADAGDEVEVTIDGNEVTKEDIVIGTVGDYGFEVEVEEDIPTLIAGKTDQEVAEFSIDDLVDDSWLPGRTVTLELPSWAEFYGYDEDGDSEEPDNSKVDNYGPLEGRSVNADFDELKFTVDGEKGEAEFDDLKVKIDADAPEGDLTIKITGSQGIEEEIVVAKVMPAFKVTAEKPEFVIGVQNQELGDITITETEEEALEDNKWVVIEAPRGMEFSECPTVEVADGDMEIDDEDIDGRFFAFRVDGESAKKASEIKISDIRMTLDRTVPVGDITFDMYLGAVSNNDFDDLIDNDDNYDKVVSVAVGEVVTPVQGDSKSVVMNLGSTLYTVDGATKVMDVAPQVIEGRTFTPVRYVAESLGAEVAYDEATKVATLTKGETVVEFTLGSSNYTVNGVAQTMDVAAQAINGRTMLPARYVAQAFGYAVGFDPATKTVVISK